MLLVWRNVNSFYFLSETEEVIAEHDINIKYWKERTKILNEQRKEQMKKHQYKKSSKIESDGLLPCNSLKTSKCIFTVIVLRGIIKYSIISHLCYLS